MRGLVELSSHVGVLLGHVGVALLHARGGLQQGCRSHGLHVADGKHRVAVTGENDLALFGELEAALDGTDRLGEHRTVGRAAAATDGTAAAMEQRQVDVVRFGPLGDAFLGGVQRQRGGGRSGVLRGIGVAEHDLELVAGGLQASLNLGDLNHFFEHIHRVLQILKLLEQRDYVDGGHILRVGECQAVELVDILDVLGALGEDRAVHLLGGDQGGLVGQAFAHFLLVAPQVLELGARRRGLGLHREVAAHCTGGFLESGDHVIGELAGHSAAHLGGDVRVTVTVGANPAARVEERGADRFDEPGLVAQNPVVEATVDLGDGVEQRVVEDVENRVRFLNRGRLLQRDWRGAEQGVDLVVETAQAFLLVRAAENLVFPEQFGDAADLAFHCLAACFSGVRGEDGVELKLVEQLLGLGRAHLVDELVVGDGELVDRIDRLLAGYVVLALMEHGNAVVLLGQVCQMEVRGECAGQQLGIV